MTIDLTKGICETDQYKAWKFPGGEIHFKFSEKTFNEFEHNDDEVIIVTRINTAENLLLLMIVIDTIKKDFFDVKLCVFILYMPYQQADRNFSDGECFSLKTITKLLNTFDAHYGIFDPHSDVTPALLNSCNILTNKEYIEEVLEILDEKQEDLVILSPDAGAYKKIFKLCSELNFQGQVESANKYRDAKTGNLDIHLSCNDFNNKSVLIIDDICVGGRTFIELASELQGRKIGNLYLAVSHGIFSNGFKDLSKYFVKIFTTNSIRDTYEDDSNSHKLIETVDIFKKYY